MNLSETPINKGKPLKKSAPSPVWGKVGKGVDGGMLMPGRSYSSDKYRFGMNGQEKDDEIAGNGSIYSAQYWEYDSRSLRRWNLDPKPDTSISQYVCFAGNPMLYTDVNGDTTKYFNEKGELLYDTKDKLKDVIVVKDKNVKKFEEKLNRLNKEGKINDPKENKEQLHILGTEISQLNEQYATTSETIDAGFSVGYEAGYNGKTNYWFEGPLSLLQKSYEEGAQMCSGYERGKEIGEKDKSKGHLNIFKPFFISVALFL